MLKDEAIEMMNAMGKDNVPFVFIINYDMTDCRVWTVDDVPDGVLFNFEGFLNSATLLIVSGHCGQNRPECDFSCSNWLFAIS